MIIQFSVANFLSFKEKATLSMVETGIKELPQNTIDDGDLGLLKCSAIYGANASGKSNLIVAMNFMVNFVKNSFTHYSVDDKIPVSSFLLNEETKGKPSFFEIVFKYGDRLYRYGFELNTKKVYSEWLYSQQGNRKEEEIFVRKDLKINVSEKYFMEGKNRDEQTRENCLFLSTVAQFNGKLSAGLLKWFRSINVYFPGQLTENTAYANRIAEQIEKDASMKKMIMEFISIADDKIIDLFVYKSENEPSASDKALNAKKSINRTLFFVHKMHDKEGKTAKSTIFRKELESQGTYKMFALAMPIIRAIQRGYVIIIDELETHLHPLLFNYIIGMFNSIKNKNGAQMIFTTHSIACMKKECLRRDQIWFTEKNDSEETDLFSLSDYKIEDKKVRKDASYCKDYLLGKYGAIPYIRDIMDIFMEEK